MGVKPFLVASSIQAVLAQRLGRVLCEKCKAIDDAPDPKFLKLVGITPEEAVGKVHKAVGCPTCKNTGYKGRKAIFEMMIMNSEIRDLAFQRAGVSRLRAAHQDPEGRHHARRGRQVRPGRGLRPQRALQELTGRRPDHEAKEHECQPNPSRPSNRAARCSRWTVCSTSSSSRTAATCTSPWAASRRCAWAAGCAT
jgi:hypothetical protein